MAVVGKDEQLVAAFARAGDLGDRVVDVLEHAQGRRIGRAKGVRRLVEGVKPRVDR